MAFRKLKAKKYNGILEYYNPKSKDKETRALYVSFRDETGTAVKKKLDTLDLQDAIKIFNDVKHEVEQKKSKIESGEINIIHLVRNKRIILNQMAELFFKDRQAKNNIKDKQIYYNRISETLGAKAVAKINTDDIQLLQNELKEKYAPKTVNETINLLRAIFNEGMKPKRGWCTFNPITTDDIKKIQEDNSAGKILSDEQLELLFTTVKDGSIDLELAPKIQLYLFLKCLYFTGARPEAILSLKYQDLDFNDNKIKLKAMKLSDGYISTVRSELMLLLKNWINEHNLKYDDYIFYPIQTYNKSHNPKDKQRAATYPVYRKMGRVYFDKLFNQGIPTTDKMNRISFYSLRRTAGTKIYKAKGIFHAMVFLNHTSIKTTQKYLNVKSDMGDITDVL